MQQNDSNSASSVLNRVIRAIVLIIVSLLISILSVSFAMHHMRLQFEDEYRSITDTKMQQVSDLVKMTVNGDEIVNDSNSAAVKYNSVFILMLKDVTDANFCDSTYAMFLYSGGQISMLVSEADAESDDFVVTKKEISEWLSSDYSNYVTETDKFESIIVPISDSQGRCVAVFEYRTDFSRLSELGDTLESRVLKAVLISVVAGVVLFVLQMFLPKILFNEKKRGDNQ